MMYLFYFCVLYSNFLAFITKNNVIKKCALFLIFLFLWIILGWSAGAYDVEVAISRYENYQYYSSFTEIGYNILVYGCNKLGMSYRLFFVLCSFFDILTIFYFVNRNSKSKLITLTLFIIFPFVIYLQYVKNILAFSFVLLGIDCLLNKRKHYILKYILFILIASSIHLNSLFFLLYLPMSLMTKKKVIIFAIILFFILLNSYSKNLFLNIINLFLGEKKVSQIGDVSINTDGQFGRIFAMIFAILEFFVLYIFFSKRNHSNLKCCYVDFFLKINILSIILIPLTMFYGIGFARFLDLLSIVNYCFYATEISNLTKIKDKKICISIIFCFFLGLIILYYRNIEYREAVLIPFFEKNDLF